MKWLNVLFVLIFLLSAALQYNDPDPVLWICIYLSAAFLAYQSIKGVFLKPLFYGALAVYVSYAVYLFFDSTGVLVWWTRHDAENIVQSMKATKPWIEETREFGGLLICIISLLVNMRWPKGLQTAQ